MNIAVDTNILAYLLLGTKPYAAEVRDLILESERIFAPDIWRAELVNVLWMSVKKKVISIDDAIRRLELAESLVTDTIPTLLLWGDAINLAIKSDHSPYDTLFLVAAQMNRLALFTYDKRLLERFPEQAKRPKN